VDTVDDLLLFQHGKELGYRFTDDRFRQMIDAFKKNNKLDDAQLKAALAEEGLTMDAWRDMAERTSIVQEVQREEIMLRAQPLDEDRRQYYAAHPNEFMTPATITLHEITVIVPGQAQNGRQVAVSAADLEEAKNKATAIRERILKGEEFGKVATEVSDSPTKATGGVLGEFKLDELDATMRDILDKLKVGEMTEPLRTPRGFQILKLDAKSTPQLQPFDKVRDAIAEKLYYQRLEVEQRKFLVKVRAQALIQWFDDGLKKAYEKRLQERLAEAK
jgi:parvulin-like peptidyl-prolyl isomerase